MPTRHPCTPFHSIPRALAVAVATLAMVGSDGAAHAMPAPPPAVKAPTLERIDAVLRARDYVEADKLIAERLKVDPDDPTLLYNHACVLAQLGRLKEAEAQLLASIRKGFDDLDHLESDPDLDPIRDGRVYTNIMEARERIEARKATKPAATRARAPAPDPLARWKDAHGDAYRYEIDADAGVAYATFLDETSHARMKETLERLERHLVEAYFRKPPDERALIAIVRPADAARYLDRPEIRGMYLHRERRLVARDTGQSLQHEFVHLVHYADMERLGQTHPIWMQEGLASLYEDYSFRGDGSVEFHPNIRFNFARRQVLSGTAREWRALTSLSADDFMKDAERHYPQVRAMFEYFARERKLEDFYRAMVATYKDDPTGATAIERAFGEPLGKIELRWRKWMRERGAVDDRVEPGDPSLGVLGDDVGDGVRITSFAPGSAARAAGLRVGDVIQSVAGSPIRSKDELVLAIARLRTGESVEVRFRRSGEETALMVLPRPLGR